MCRPGAVRLLPHGQSGRGHDRSSIRSTQHLISRGRADPQKRVGNIVSRVDFVIVASTEYRISWAAAQSGL